MNGMRCTAIIGSLLATAGSAAAQDPAEPAPGPAGGAWAQWATWPHAQPQPIRATATPADDDAPIGAVIAGATVGYLIGAAFGVPFVLEMTDDADLGGDTDVILTAIAVEVALAGTGLAAGAALLGDRTGGNGTFSCALLGQALGGVASLGLMLLAAATGASIGSAIVAFTSVVVLPIAGGVIGYSMSDAARDGPAVDVGVAAVPGGGILALHARF